MRSGAVQGRILNFTHPAHIADDKLIFMLRVQPYQISHNSQRGEWRLGAIPPLARRVHHARGEERRGLCCAHCAGAIVSRRSQRCARCAPWHPWPGPASPASPARTSHPGQPGQTPPGQAHPRAQPPAHQPAGPAAGAMCQSIFWYCHVSGRRPRDALFGQQTDGKKGEIHAAAILSNTSRGSDRTERRRV